MNQNNFFGLKNIATSVVIISIIMLGAHFSYAEVKAPKDKNVKKLSVKPPEKQMGISLVLDNESISTAFKKLAEQAGWNLALSLPSKVEEQKITVSFTEKPALDILQALLDIGDLEAQLNGQMIIIKPKVRANEQMRTPESISDDDEHISKIRKRRTSSSHGKSIVRFGEDITVEKDEVYTDVVAVGGSILIKGHVTEDAVAVGGSITLEPGARVDKDIVNIGGKLNVADGAFVGKDRVSIGGTISDGLKNMMKNSFFKHGSHSWSRHFGSSIVGTFVRALVLIILGLLFITFLPERMVRIREYLTQKPGVSTLGALGLVLSFIPFCILLAITIIGIPLIPVAVLLFVITLMMGLAAFASWLGYRIPLFVNKKTPFVALFIGVVILMILDLIPVIGTALVVVVAFISAGAVLVSRFGRNYFTKDSTLE